MNQFDFEQREASEAAIEQQRDRDARYAEAALTQLGWNSPTNFMSLNLSDDQVVTLQQLLNEFSADDERTIEQKLTQVFIEWMAWKKSNDEWWSKTC